MLPYFILVCQVDNYMHWPMSLKYYSDRHKLAFRFQWSKLYQNLSSVQSCLTLCDPMDCSIPGLPVHHQLLELTQTHVHGKTIALTRQTFVGKVMSLLSNTLSRLVIAFLSRSKHFLISWLQSPSVVISKPKKIKSVTVSIVSASICHEVMGPDAMIKISSVCLFYFVLWLISSYFLKILPSIDKPQSL